MATRKTTIGGTLGTAATKNVGTTAGTVAAGNDSRFNFTMLDGGDAASTYGGVLVIDGGNA